MAHSTLSVLHSPEFPQVYAAAIDDAIRAVDRVLLAHNTLLLGKCQYEYPETSPGACNGLPCAETGTVFDQENELEYCVGHFREVSRG